MSTSQSLNGGEVLESEDWAQVTDAADRRRIQNRNAQRNYRKNIKLKLAEFERQKTSLAGLQSTLLGMQGDESPLLISQPSNTPRSLPPTERRMSLGTGPTECGNEAAGMMPFWMPGYSIGQPDYNLNPFPGSITPIEGEGNSPANLAVDEPPYPRNAEPCVSFGSILQRPPSISSGEELKSSSTNTIDAYCQGKRTALQQAVINGHKGIARLLLDKGASVEAPCSCGKTSLHLAAIGGYTPIVLMLLAHHANAEAVDKEGKTPAHHAAQYGHSLVIQILLQSKIDINQSDSMGQTMLHLAVRGRYQEVVIVLLDNNAGVDNRDCMGWTALNWAIQQGSEALVRLLVERGADVNA